MNLYIKYIDTNDSFETGNECTVFYEVTNDYPTRQLLVSDNKLVGSNRKDKIFDYFLADCSIRIDDFDDSDDNFQIITEKEFEEVWTKHCDSYKNQWENSKNKFKIGTKVHGKVEVLYPQGIILMLDENAIAIANYDNCLNNSSVTSIYPHQKITGRVKGYDEINMWIIIEMPRVIS